MIPSRQLHIAAIYRKPRTGGLAMLAPSVFVFGVECNTARPLSLTLRRGTGSKVTKHVAAWVMDIITGSKLRPTVIWRGTVVQLT